MRRLSELMDASRTILPAQPAAEAEGESGVIYETFMHHLRCVPSSRPAIRTLSAIHFTADALECSDAHVAKVLVDLGLRAPRMAFPAEYLRFADGALGRSGWEIGGPSPALAELKAHWDSIGEERFAAFRHGERVPARGVAAEG